MLDVGLSCCDDKGRGPCLTSQKSFLETGLNMFAASVRKNSLREQKPKLALIRTATKEKRVH